MEILYDYGFRGKILDLLTSYLQNRHQCVKIGDITSGHLPLITGTPQGTVLGPILFLLYVNSIFGENCDENVKILSFADDTVVISTAESWQLTHTNLEMTIKNIYDFMNVHKLKLNTTKSKFITFTASRKTQPDNINIKIHAKQCVLSTCACSVLTRAQSITYLGIVLDCNLRWEDHVSQLTNKLRRLQYGFKIMSKICSFQNLIRLYQSLVQSIISYGLIVWGGCFNSNIVKLQVIQKRILKIILHKPDRYPTNLLFSETQILSINQLYHHQICKYIYYHRKDILHIDHHYSTRLNSKLSSKTDRCYKKITQCYFKSKISRIYNTLPENIKNIKSYYSFSKKTKLWIQSYV